MRKTLLEMYALLVCFVTVICFAIAFGIMLYQLITVISPEFTLENQEYERFSNNDKYWNSIKPICSKYDKSSCIHTEKPSNNELTNRREKDKIFVLKSESRSGFQSVIKSLIIVIIDLIIFISHWLIARRAREMN